MNVGSMFVWGSLNGISFNWLKSHGCSCFEVERFAIQSQEEKSYSGSESEMKQIVALTSSLLASSASYFLISGRNPLDSSEYFLEYFKIFHCVNFQRSKSLAEKTFAFNKNPRKPWKFSHRETFIVYGKANKIKHTHTQVIKTSQQASQRSLSILVVWHQHM